jgi:hypothetical protein
MMPLIPLTLGMMMGAAAGNGAARAMGARPWPGVVKLVEWDDGGFIARISGAEGFHNAIIPLWSQWSEHDWSHSLGPVMEGPSPNHAYRAYAPMFVYVDPEGCVLAVAMTNDPTDPAKHVAVVDAGGPGLGRVTDRMARRRMAGFLFNLLIPDRTDLFAQDVSASQADMYKERGRKLAYKLGIPAVFPDKIFQRSMTGKSTKFRQHIRGMTPDPGRRVTREMADAVDALIRSKHLNPLGMGDHVRPHGRYERTVLPTDRDPGASNPPVLRYYAPLEMGSHRGPHLGLSFDVRTLTWTAYIFPEMFAEERPCEVLGRSTAGPFELFVELGMAIPESGLDAWLDEHADMDGVEVFDAYFYELLDEKGPIHMDQDTFDRFARGIS